MKQVLCWLPLVASWLVAATAEQNDPEYGVDVVSHFSRRVTVSGNHVHAVWVFSHDQ